MVGMIFVKHTVKVEFDRICIHRGSVMERDAGSQRERVDRAVCADVPAFRQRRFNLEGAVLVADQPVIHVHQNSKVIHRRYRSRIKRFRLGNLAHHKHVIRRACRCQPGCKAQRQCERNGRDYGAASRSYDGHFSTSLK